MPPKKPNRTELHLLRLAAFLAGIGVFYYAVQYFGGFPALWMHLSRLSPMVYVWVMINSLVWTLSYTVAWKHLLRDKRHLIPFSALFKVKACGEAVNLMTPAGFIVGDPVRVMLLKKYVGPQARLRSVVVDRAIHSLAAQLFCFFGLLLIFSQDVAFPLWINVIMLSIYTVALWTIISLIMSMVSGKSLGVFERLFKILKISKRLPSLNAKIVELRDELSYYADKPKRHFYWSFFYHFFGRVLGAVEISIIVYYFTGSFLWSYAVILTALTSFVSVVAGLVPGALGFLEALYAAFAKLYGFNPAMGLTIQIVRRLRILFWIAVGILILDYGELVNAARGNKAPGKKDSEGKN